jgi:hypothetical protein
MKTKKVVMFCVIYRTGGRENFAWNRSAADTKEGTLQRLRDVRKQGYHAFMDKYESSIAIGLPETYE